MHISIQIPVEKLEIINDKIKSTQEILGEDSQCPKTFTLFDFPIFRL